MFGKYLLITLLFMLFIPELRARFRAAKLFLVIVTLFFAVEYRKAIIDFFKAPATRLEVYVMFTFFYILYGIFVIITKGIDLNPLFNVIFFSIEGRLACAFIFINFFFTFITNYSYGNLFSWWLLFKDTFTLVYYGVALYILTHWSHWSLFIATFLLFEIIIHLIKNDIKYAAMLRLPLLGFYAGILAYPQELLVLASKSSLAPEYTGFFAMTVYIVWLYDITGVSYDFWVDLHNSITDFGEFACSEGPWKWLIENSVKPFWIFAVVLLLLFSSLTYVFEKQWQYLVYLRNYNTLRLLSCSFPIIFLIFFLKNWTYFHMFVFVIFLSEIAIFFLKKLESFYPSMHYAWMLRFPVAGFIVGVISMPIENIPLELASEPRGYFATWVFIEFLHNSLLFDFSYNSVINFHDFLVTISDPILIFFDVALGNTALTNVLYAIIYAVTILTIIIVIAFFTVFERKVLAAIQRRRGPNVVGAWGLLQVIADGLKLLSKEPLFVSGVNYYIFLLAPIFLFTISLTAWAFIPIPGYEFNITSSYTFLLVFLITGLNSFAIILAGISSNSRYSLIGGIRAIAQLISYEIPLSISILILFIIQGSFDLHQFIAMKIILSALALPALLIFFICLLAETNRTPFDLPEAEAELVAGYNLEYSSILFSLFFLAEYNNIMIAASLLSIMFFGEHFFYIGVMFFCLVIIFVRSILPRYTFAQLINMCWTALFPLSVLLLILLVVLMYLFDISSASFIRPDVVETISDILKEPKDLVILSVTTFVSATTYVLNGGTPKTNVFIFFIVAFAIVSLLVAANWILVNFKSNNRKNSPYECGFEPVGSPISDFTPNFLAVALIFLIYDVEILLTFPWAYSFYAKTAAAVFCFVFFLIIMLLGLIYEILDDSFHVY